MSRPPGSQGRKTRQRGGIGLRLLVVFAPAGLLWVLAIVGSLVILKICDMTVGLRVNRDDEIQGLDVSMHGEEGYNFEA